MAKITPIPLFTTLDNLKHTDAGDYPDLFAFLNDGPGWRLQNWRWAQEFLLFIGRHKSSHTFTRFRSEIERFLLWLYLYKDQTLESLKKNDVLEYMDFIWQPPLNWISLVNVEKFQLVGGSYRANKAWAPFRMVVPKGSNLSKADKKKYRPSQQSIHAAFTALNALYKYLVDEEHIYGNPIQVAKKHCRLIHKDAQVKEVKRLTEQQWEYLLKTAHKMADEDHLYERNLFLIAAMKTLFLRISEFSERPDWSPHMGHFWQDHNQNWWLKVYGKGRKLRDITVPDGFIPYLKRYRTFRGLDALPVIRESEPIIEKVRGRGGMTSRQLTRLVQNVFDRAHQDLLLQAGADEAQNFKQATTHWLRHTGASLEIERGRPLKDVSEDLGHASMAITDAVYIQSESQKRAASGKNRKV